MKQKQQLAKSIVKYSTFMSLKTSSDQILALMRDNCIVPKPIRKDPATRDNGKYCDFHQDHGHLTLECFQLKSQIEVN